MDKSDLAHAIRMAATGDTDAIEMVIRYFMQMINCRCVLNGRIDEDLRQFMFMCVIEGFPKSHIK